MSTENEVISYMEMCQRERAQLQRGMNFALRKDHSVILMSVRPGAPYADSIEDDGATLIYEGHDMSRGPNIRNPKELDQPEFLPSGRPTQNGLFRRAAIEYTQGKRKPERVRVYEKIKKGIWSYNGIFHLVDAWTESDGVRQVFKFKLLAVEGEEDLSKPIPRAVKSRRIIPTEIKVEVWQRDGGQCVKCGATNELHFDHVLPYAKGGTSLKVENVQLLCARHNIQKSDHII